MNVLRGIAGAIILGLLFATSISAQVRVTVPGKKYAKDAKITATVSNESSQPITVCVASGQISTTKEVVVSTPVPFEIEGKVRERWKALMASPEGGGDHQAVVLESKKSLEFPFWPPDKGELRLRMKYWEGARPNMDCAQPGTDAHEAKGVTFEILRKLE
jgi:hypothetical protein